MPADSAGLGRGCLVRTSQGWYREKGNGIVDFVGIHRKSSGSVIKVQLEGHNESLEFPWVGAVKSIRLFDLGVDVVRSRVV